MASESRRDPLPAPLFTLSVPTTLPQHSHIIQGNVTAEAEQPFHNANAQSGPKRPDESNLIPQISLSLSRDYEPHEGRG